MDDCFNFSPNTNGFHEALVEAVGETVPVGLVGVGAGEVNLVQVDRSAEAPHRSFGGIHDVAALRPPRERCKLRRYRYFLPISILHSCRKILDQGLGAADAVQLSGVEEADAILNRVPKDCEFAVSY